MAISISAPNVSDAALRKTAGIGALISALFYLLQPLAVLVLIPEATQEEFKPSPRTLPGSEWQGPYEVAVFSGVAVGTLLLVVALAMLQARRATVLDWVGTVLGVSGAAGWIAVAGLSLAQHSLVALSLGDIGASLETQQSDFQAVAIVLTGLVGIAVFGGAGWAIISGLAVIRGRSELGRAAGVIALAGGIGVLGAALVSLHPITGALLLIPIYVLLGVVLLASSRRSKGGTINHG